MAALLRITNAGSTVPIVIGSSTAPGHTSWIELESVHFGSASMSPGASGSTKPTTTANMTEVHVLKRQDKSSAALFLMCATGKAGYDGQIDLLADNSKDGLPYMTYVLTDVLISSFQVGGSSGGDSAPGESIEILTRKTEANYKSARKA